MGSVCVHKKDLAGDNPHISVKSRILSRQLKQSVISEMCSAIPRLLEHSETSRMFQNHPEQIRVNSSISEASRRSEQYRNAPEDFRYDPNIPSPTVDIWSITQHAKKSRISAVKPRTSQTVVWFSRAADSSSVLCGHDFLIGLGEFPFMERRKESVLFILRELLEPKWWPGVLR